MNEVIKFNQLKDGVEVSDEQYEFGANSQGGGGGDTPTGDISDCTVNFNIGDNYNLTSGSKISALIGKIKYFITNIADVISEHFPTFTTSATIDGGTGDPSVEANYDDVNKAFTFAFHNIRGLVGERGPRGYRGETGEQGIQGVTGERGPAGVDGITPDIEIGDVITLLPGEQAQATITGTASHPLLNLGIPQGAKGNTGDTGAPGADGRDGTNGTNGTNGADGSFIWSTTNDYTTPNYTFLILDLDGPTGETPKADDFIIQNVNNRTYMYRITSAEPNTVLADYVCELTGATGPAGPAGADGTDGTDGTNGVGVPTGGTTGQVLAKSSDDDYATEWITPSGGGSSENWEWISGDNKTTASGDGNIQLDFGNYLLGANIYDKIRVVADMELGGYNPVNHGQTGKHSTVVLEYDLSTVSGVAPSQERKLVVGADGALSMKLYDMYASVVNNYYAPEYNISTETVNVGFLPVDSLSSGAITYGTVPAGISIRVDVYARHAQ